VASAEVDLDPPIAVDWLLATDLRDARPGRLGMTILPGKHGASLRYPGVVYRRELDRDLVALRRAGVRRLLLLVDEGELARWGDRDIVGRAAGHGIVVDHRPMADGSAPTSASAMDAMLASVAAGRAEGDVAVACMGGVGRTGTVAACALVAAGWSSDAAIAHVRAVRHPGAVETAGQEAFVRAYEGHVAAARDRSGKVAP
jgi:protein-tyrosine phosphatase